MKPRLQTLVLVCATAFLSSVALSQPAEPRRPNIVLVMADDQGWGDTSYNGHPELKTPNLDALARSGLRLDRFYTAHFNCSPTRGSIMTGRHPARYGTFGPGSPIRAQELTVATVLQSAGYATGHFGKWHLNGKNGDKNTTAMPGRAILAADPLSPGKLGFDEWVSADNFFDLDPVLGRNGVPEKFHGDSSDITTDEALKFIRRQAGAGKAFLAVVWFGSPHVPHLALAADKEAYRELPEKDQNYYGEIAAVDRSVGRLRAELRELKAADHTLLWYCSDNGGAAGPKSTGDLRGSKGTLWDGGLRVPGIVEWPARIPKPFVTQMPCSTLDMYPTILEATGAVAQNQIQPLDGISLLPLFDRKTGSRPKPIPFWSNVRSHDSHAALLDWPFKLHLKPVAGRNAKGKNTDAALPAVLLYDVSKDPKETTDLAAQEPGRVEKMTAALDTWKASVGRSLAGAETTSLPAAEVDRVSARPELITTLGFGSCARQERPQPIWDAINAARCDAFVLLGDNIYADTSDPVVFREKYALLAAMPGFARLRDTTPLFVTWDDHDYGTNDGGAGFPGATVAQKEFCDFFQVPAASPLRTTPGVYDCVALGPAGKRVQLILLDTRAFRSPLKKDQTNPKVNIPNTDPGATVLGEGQWAWFERRLREPAEIRVVVSSIQLIANEHGSEKWDNFPKERSRFLELLRRTQSRGVVVISGDRHMAELSALTPADGVAYPLYDLTTSGLNQPVEKESEHKAKNPPKPQPNRYRLHERPYTGSNFGLLRVKWDGPNPSLRLEVCGLEGQVVISRDIPFSELRPK